MLYAKVVFGLSIQGPFDYIIPEELRLKVKSGSRVLVSFGTRNKIGYVTGTSSKSSVKNLKSIIKLLDNSPLLDENLLKLTKKISEYYCCSWGEAIESALPPALRKNKATDTLLNSILEKPNENNKILLLNCHDFEQRWKIYLKKMKPVIEEKKNVLILLPDKPELINAEKIIRQNFDLPIEAIFRNQPKELDKWLNIKNAKARIVLAIRSGVFAPLDNIGLIIVETEEAYAYKQDQVPHYHAREVAIQRAQTEKINLILGSQSPSLESINLARNKNIDYEASASGNKYSDIKIIDMKGLPLISHRKNIILSRQMEESISQTLNAKGKVLLFLNRKGFATIGSCITCGHILKCERCNINLVYHFKENILSCHYCNFKKEVPKICPACNSGYIRYWGAGTEKIESELARIFPQAELGKDITVASQAIIKDNKSNFDLIGILDIDNSLNHVDFRAAEKTFGMLTRLAGLTDKKMIIQTSLPQHYCFKALEENNPDIFYDAELKLRKELKFPPFKHLALIKLRGKYEEKVKRSGEALFDDLCSIKQKATEILSLNQPTPSKLRGSYYWQILIRGDSPYKITEFLKSNLKNFKHSGIIVTTDIDPI